MKIEQQNDRITGQKMCDLVIPETDLERKVVNYARECIYAIEWKKHPEKFPLKDGPKVCLVMEDGKIEAKFFKITR